MAFVTTRDNERLLALLKRKGKIPENLTHLNGLNISEVVESDGTPGFALILGPVNGGMDGRAPQAIQMSLKKSEQPILQNGRILKADVMEDGDGFKLVKPFKKEVALRVITTGLLYNMRDGSTTQDMIAIAREGKKLRYHGVFPLTHDAASIVGEGIDSPVITGQSRILTDDRFGTIKNLAGVHRLREITIEGVVGGPVLVGQIDGTLKIHELQANGGWKVHDVTNSPQWQQKFMDLANQDVDYLAALAKDERRKKRKALKVTKGPPSDHMDA